MKRALRLRASSDSKARRYAQKLADALRLSQDAAAQLNALNQLYNVDVSTQTILVHDLLDIVQPDQLTTVLGQSTPGEELQLFNPIPDGNGGQPLPPDVLFGEVVSGPPVVSPPPVLRDESMSPPQIPETVEVDA
ncbi:hypothetical protein HW556_06300 [Hymenobacter sp. P5252]|uniref:Uncharacterized protein n=2 Tax=Hymenobacter terrestris TaxID=2748310 RepID=A0ABX2Q0L1_9BACT|nr:hypothetical protein [Hymenobacter terrestris]